MKFCLLDSLPEAYLGAGIVRGSVPEDELRELDLKAEALFASFVPHNNKAST